jgi:hypothetical protein
MSFRTKMHSQAPAMRAVRQTYAPKISPQAPLALSFLLSLAIAAPMTPPAVAQVQQFSAPALQGGNGNGSTTAAQFASANGVSGNLTPQQKYLRDSFLFRKLKAVDALIKQSQRVQARQILEDLVTLDPNPYSHDVHGLLAECCYKLGNNPEAIKNYELAIQYDNDKDVQPYWNIALAYINMNNYEQANIWCKKLLAKNPPPELRSQAERFLNDVGREKHEQQNTVDRPGGDGSGDYLNHLASSREANRWPRGKIPIKVFIEDDRNVPGFRAQYVTIFLNCLEIWTKATQHRLVFQMVDNLSQSNLDIIFTANVADIARQPGMAPAEQGLATVRCLRPPAGYGEIEHARIQLLVHKPTSDKELTDDEMKEVCLHEIGHALGLSGHSPNDSDVMHFMMSFRQLPALTKADKQTIAKLYQDYPSLNQNANTNYQASNLASEGQYQAQFKPSQFQAPVSRSQQYQPLANQQQQFPPQQYQQPQQQQQYSQPQQNQQQPYQQQQQPHQQQYLHPQENQQPPYQQQQQFQQPQQYQQQRPPQYQQQQQPVQQPYQGQPQYQAQQQNQNQSEFPTLQQFFSRLQNQNQH